jgi:hypothetical protein
MYARLWLLLLMAGGVSADCCTTCQSIMRNNGYNDFFTDSDIYWACRNRGCQDTCGVGQYDASTCEGLGDGSVYTDGIYKCQACPGGTYRNNIQTQAGCVACRSPCSATQAETTPCGPINDRVCQECLAGTVLLNNQCVYCPYETYTLDRQTCLGCTTCSTLQYVTSPCQINQNRACADCPLGSKTTGLNSAPCSLCIDGYYDPGTSPFTCISCDLTTCQAQRWVNCAGGTRTCSICAGHQGGTVCAVGTGVPGTCTGASRVNPPCTPCRAGTERTSTTPLGADNVQVCVKCATGKYKAVNGTSACLSCANKPSNSVYRAYLLTEPATTSACPW